jgi:cyclin-dependent kinase 12/13
MDDSSFKTILRTNNVNKTYKIIAEVGSGTYGRVYKAKCLKTN